VAAEILDFKTDDIAPEDLPARTLHYAPQMQAYRAALAALLGLKADLIRANLLFVTLGVAVNIGPANAS
jgi:ATP-dependent exoDNAse (exonuclease V) beta subunit